MSQNVDLLQAGLTHHRAGRLQQAEQLYRQALSQEPRNAHAMHLLGLLASQCGRHDIAVQWISDAIRCDPGQAVFHMNLGEAYRGLGQLDNAAACYRQTVALAPNLAEAHNNLGTIVQHQGNAAEAISCYNRALAIRPDYPDALNNLGTIYQAQQRWSEALDSYRRAVQVDPRYARGHYNQGMVLEAQGRLEEACSAFRKVVELNDESVDAHYNLATLLQRRGELPSAEIEYRQVLRLRSNYAEAHNNLGTILKQLGRVDEALDCYREAARHNPHSPMPPSNLGVALKELGRIDEAIECYREALRIQSDFAGARLNLGFALHAAGQRDEALAEFSEALRIRADYGDAVVDLAATLEKQGRLDDALRLYDVVLLANPRHIMAHYRRANIFELRGDAQEAIAGLQTVLRLEPNFPAAYLTMAAIYLEFVQPDEALECCRQGLKLDPNSSSLHGAMGVALHRQGRGLDAIAAYRRAIELQPDDTIDHSNLLYSLNFQPEFDAPTIFAEHLAWAARHAEPLTAAALPHVNDRAPDRRLRIGYVSPNFRLHAVNYFIEPILMSHDHERFEIVCYSDVQFGDEITDRLKRAADRWRDVAHLSDEQLADGIRSDAIDILVDLTGHIGGNRLLTFARKPAPVQVTYIGYQNTTGMSAMDYRLTDERADPPGQTDRYYTERLVRLPRAFFCYKPADEAPQVTASPAASAGFVTFGSFNHFRKVTPQVVDVWLTILARMPDSRLLLLAYRGGYLERHWHQLARDRGIDPGRIELFNNLPLIKYLQLLQRADIALDPFPFNGHTTTCDSIWMGLPVVMLEGDSYPSRFGGSVLANVGLERWIARSVDAYIDLAVALANDRDELVRLRAELRPRMAASALLDYAGFTRNLEDAYRRMWQQWCAAAVR